MVNIGDVVDLVDAGHSDSAVHLEPGSSVHDRFLIDEGLGLLAAYRAIQDDGVRDAIRTLIGALAKTGQAAGEGSTDG